MSTSDFIIIEHTSPCSYIREFPHATKKGEDDPVLQLVVKEYRPREYADGKNLPYGAITIIATHGNGFPKETYEPLFADLVAATRSKSIAVRGIWIADLAHQGASYAINQKELGDDPSWLDHSRDLLLMINHFRDKMKPPFIGLGHSMGCTQIVNLALLHPRLFNSLILMDPVMQARPPPGPNAAMFSSMRRENWASRAQAEAQIRRNGFFKAMDPRALDAYVKYALQDTPDGGVELATPKAQEAWTYVRSNFHPLPAEGDTSEEAKQLERVLYPDVKPLTEMSRAMFPQPAVIPVVESLPKLRPRTLYLHGDYSHINYDEIREEYLATTGVGQGGSGGAAEGGVEERTIEDGTHLCPFEKPVAISKEAAAWLEKEVLRWKKEKEFWATYDSGKSKNGRTALSEKWIASTKEDAWIERTGAKSGPKL